MAWSGMSVRAKLTLSTVAVLACIYILLGLTVNFAASRTIQSSIDASLHRDADRLVDMWVHPPPRPHPPDRPPGGFGDHGPPGPNDNGPPGPDDFGPPRPDDHIPPFLRHFDLPKPSEGQYPPLTVWRRPDFDIPVASQANDYDPDSIAVALQGRQRLSTVVWEDQPIRVLTTTLPARDRSGGVVAVIQFAYPLSGVNRTLARD